jgi:hypothetical protein
LIDLWKEHYESKQYEKFIPIHQKDMESDDFKKNFIITDDNVLVHKKTNLSFTEINRIFACATTSTTFPTYSPKVTFNDPFFADQINYPLYNTYLDIFGLFEPDDYYGSKCGLTFYSTLALLHYDTFITAFRERDIVDLTPFYSYEKQKNSNITIVEFRDYLDHQLVIINTDSKNGMVCEGRIYEGLFFRMSNVNNLIAKYESINEDGCDNKHDYHQLFSSRKPFVDRQYQFQKSTVLYGVVNDPINTMNDNINKLANDFNEIYKESNQKELLQMLHDKLNKK